MRLSLTVVASIGPTWRRNRPPARPTSVTAATTSAPLTPTGHQYWKPRPGPDSLVEVERWEGVELRPLISWPDEDIEKLDQALRQIEEWRSLERV